MIERPTNDNDAQKRIVTFPGGFEFEGELFLPVGYSLMISILLCPIALILFQAGIILSVVIAILPPVLTGAYIFTFLNRKPPGFHMNVWEVLVFGNGRWYDAHSQPHHPILGDPERRDT